MAEEKFWVVEFRFPIAVGDVETAEDAALEAAKKFETEYGLNPSRWFARAFRYGKDSVGPVEEYFFNPAGVKAYVKDKNHLEHKDIIDGQDRT